MDDEPANSRNETPHERADRNWGDLLQELRVSQTGVQILAGFLISLPFQSRFDDLDAFQKQWYLGVLGLALLTVGVILSPVAIHRLMFQGGAKPQIVAAAHVLTGLALALIALLLASSAFLVVDVVIDRTVAAVAGLGVLTVLMVLLVLVPHLVASRARSGQRENTFH